MTEQQLHTEAAKYDDPDKLWVIRTIRELRPVAIGLFSVVDSIFRSVYYNSGEYFVDKYEHHKAEAPKNEGFDVPGEGN